MKRIFAAFVFFAFALHAEQFGPVSVEQVPQAVRNIGRNGYFITEFRVANRGAEPAEVRMRLYSKSGFDCSAVRALLLAPGSVRNVTLYWPPVSSMNWRRSHIQPALALTVNGKRWENSLLSGAGFSEWNRTRGGNILISGTVPVSDYREFFAESAKPWMERQLAVSDIPVAQWGEHQRDYSSADVIWISSADRVPPEVDRTLSNWVFAGGTLVVVVPPDEPWPEGKEPSGGRPLTVSHGWGGRVLVRPIPAAGLKTRPGKEKKESTPGLEYLKRQVKETGIVGDPGRLEVENCFSLLKLPIPGVPLQLLFFVMLVFVIVIGPVNFMILRKLRREPLILLTTPVISLLFCLLVIGFITMGEGWYSRAKAVGVTLLDQDANLAATRAVVAVYAPSAPRGGFEFDSEDVLRFAGAGRLELREDNSQHLAAGLLQPRIPLGYSAERVSVQREHLKLTREAEGVGVVNGLGVRLVSLFVVAPDGAVYAAAGKIEPGARALLRPSGETAGKPDLDSDKVWTQATLGGGFFRPNGIIPRGYYVAVAEEPLFWTPGFRPDRFEVRHAVIGKFSFAGDSKDGN